MQSQVSWDSHSQDRLVQGGDLATRFSWDTNIACADFLLGFDSFWAIDFQTCFLLYQTMCTFTTPTGFQSTPVEAMFRTWCRSLHGMSQQEPGVRWVGRCTWKTQGPINPDRWNPQTVGKKKLSQKEVTFESTTLQSFRFDVIWRDLMWFVDVCAGWKTLHTIITTDGSQYYINKHWLSQWPSFKTLGDYIFSRKHKV